VDLHDEAGPSPVAIKYSNMGLYKSRKLSVRRLPGLHHHRALYDCYITAALLLDIINVSGWTPEEMATITGRPALLTTFTFGKYRGKPSPKLRKTIQAICAGCSTTWIA
jgi:DNA polymerase III epsilon subunit-like protein